MNTANRPNPLLQLLTNDLILRHTSPYVGIRSLVLLAATSKAFNSLVYNTPQVFQYASMYGTKGLGMVRNIPNTNSKVNRLDGQRLGNIFSVLAVRNVMQDVRTLILDRLYVPATLIEDILLNERYQVRLLSLRMIHGSDITDILQILRHVLKSSRKKGMLKLRGLYLFGQPNDIHEACSVHDATVSQETHGITAAMGAQLGAGSHMDHDDFRKHLREDPYYDSVYGVQRMSDFLRGADVQSGWPELLEACAGLIAFDAILCRHNRESVSEPRSSLATVRLAGCKSCGTCPEGPAYPGSSPADHIPLLSPLPLHSSRVEVAQCIETKCQPYPPLIVRCRTCLKDRWCERCNFWWCESCYTIPKDRTSTTVDPSSTVPGQALNKDIKVHTGLCVSQCLMDELWNGVGEGGMWG